MSLARAQTAPDTISRSDRSEPAFDGVGDRHRALARQALLDLSPRLDLSALVHAHELRRAIAPQPSSRSAAAPRV